MPRQSVADVRDRRHRRLRSPWSRLGKEVHHPAGEILIPILLILLHLLSFQDFLECMIRLKKRSCRSRSVRGMNDKWITALRQQILQVWSWLALLRFISSINALLFYCSFCGRLVAAFWESKFLNSSSKFVGVLLSSLEPFLVRTFLKLLMFYTNLTRQVSNFSLVRHNTQLSKLRHWGIQSLSDLAEERGRVIPRLRICRFLVSTELDARCHWQGLTPSVQNRYWQLFVFNRW